MTDSNVIDFETKRAVTQTAAEHEPPGEVIDALLGILKRAKAAGCISDEDRRAFSVYAVGVVGDGWQLRWMGAPR